MSWKLIASGDKSDVSSMPAYESQVGEGQRARADFKFVASVPAFQVNVLRSSLEFAGVNDLKVIGTGDTVSVIYRKDPWWVPVIIVAVLAIAVLLISWFFFKEVKEALGPGLTWGLAIGGAVLGGIGGYYLFKGD